MKAGIIVFPGINRERDMAIALERSSGHVPRMIWHTETDLSGLDLVVIPGGFSYGDYLRCGAMAAQSPIMGAVRLHVARGGYLLGACNGFQIVVEAGLLPGALLRNASLRFLAMDCFLTRRTNRYRFHQPVSARPSGTGGPGTWRRELFR